VVGVRVRLTENGRRRDCPADPGVRHHWLGRHRIWGRHMDHGLNGRLIRRKRWSTKPLKKIFAHILDILSAYFLQFVCNKSRILVINFTSWLAPRRQPVARLSAANLSARWVRLVDTYSLVEFSLARPVWTFHIWVVATPPPSILIVLIYYVFEW